MKKKFEFSLTEIFFYSYTLFVYYLTLKPFSVSLENQVVFHQLSKLANSVIYFRQMWSANTGDVIANILMFIPLGFFLALFLLKRYHFQFSVKLFLLNIFIVFSLTASIEFLQLFNRYRFPSIVDIFNNLIGGMIGAGILFLIIGKVRSNLMQWEAWFFRNLRLQLVLTLSFVFIAYACFPFDIDFSKYWIYRHLRVLTDTHFKIVEWFNAFPYVIILSLIAIQLEEIETEFVPVTRAPIGLIFYLPALLVGTVIMQLICRHRYFSFSEMIFLLIILGFWEWRLWRTVQLKSGIKFFKKHDASIILAMYVVFLVSASLLPLNFHQNAAQKLTYFFQPFHDYEGDPRIIVILDFFKDMFKYSFFGILFSYFADHKKMKITTIHYGIIIGLLFILELLQIFNKIYSPDVVDILLGIIGFIGGMKGYTYVKYQYTQIRETYID